MCTPIFRSNMKYRWTATLISTHKELNAKKFFATRSKLWTAIIVFFSWRCIDCISMCALVRQFRCVWVYAGWVFIWFVDVVVVAALTAGSFRSNLETGKNPQDAGFQGARCWSQGVDEREFCRFAANSPNDRYKDTCMRYKEEEVDESAKLKPKKGH